MTELDRTHEPARLSWVASANGHPDFPIQNLPLGIFTPADGGPRRGGIAIGDHILDLAALSASGDLSASGILSGDAARAADAAARPELNALFALGAGPRRALRLAVSDALAEGSASAAALEAMLHPASACTLHRPARIGGYTDFYAGIHHALNVGRLFRPDNPLLPNYKHVPIAYHGRASSIRISGAPVVRPSGQRKGAGEDAPSFGPSRSLDFELELGAWIGPGNALGSPIPIGTAAEHIAGFCLLNDWSARDVQAWEYQPLGPFLAKNFASTISPWVVTPDALAPFRIAQPPRPPGDPVPLPYLSDAADQASGAFDLDLSVSLSTAKMRAAGLPPQAISRSNARHLYWTLAQMVAHHTCNGCNLEPGDLIGTGTISAPDPEGCGSLLELTLGGKRPLALASGETRTYLEDGDEIVLSARASRSGFAPIGFGECSGRVEAAVSPPRKVIPAVA